MTEELRLVLLLAGFVIIGYIAWDAKRRKNRKPSEFLSEDKFTNKTSQNIVGSATHVAEFDDDGYDQLGLTTARVAAESSVLKQQKPLQQEEQPPLTRVEPSFEDAADKAATENNKAIDVADNDTVQTENFEDSSNMESMQKPETVVTINLMSDANNEFKGSELLQELLTLGFKFGDMGVFHRYQHANGQGERWFSLANAINPGSFVLEDMASFKTPGLTLFMLLPGPQKPTAAFENMLNAANKLKAVLGGKLEDGSHSVLSQQRIQLYREEILTFQKNYLAKINHSDEDA